jgi:uncharacterized phage protein (TIGR01671 family)
MKFRAYDEDLKSIIYGDDIEEFRMPPPPDSESADEGPNRYITGLSYGKLFIAYYKNGDWQECKIMQFTGLKDKNGNEIYEGDIVSDENGTTAIEWASGMGAWGLLDSDRCMFMLADCNETMGVVGNIYETPELLTK